MISLRWNNRCPHFKGDSTRNRHLKSPVEPCSLYLSTIFLQWLALWWLIESAADEFEMPPEQAADEVALMCGLAKEMIASGSGHLP